MRKVKILYSKFFADNYDGYYDTSVLFPAAGDWDEVDDKEYAELSEAVAYANCMPSTKQREGKYFLVEYSDTMREEVFRSTAEFKQKMIEAQRKDAERAAEEKRKRDEKAQERKRKQLEKLKRELGEK